MVIQSREEAIRFGRKEVADVPAPGELEVGTHVLLDPCVPQPWPDTRATSSRICPRVDLDSENVVPMALVQLLLDERNAPAFVPMFEATCGWRDDDERASILARVTFATSSEPVRDARRRIDEESRRRSEASASKARRHG